MTERSQPCKELGERVFESEKACMQRFLGVKEFGVLKMIEGQSEGDRK